MIGYVIKKVTMKSKQEWPKKMAHQSCMGTVVAPVSPPWWRELYLVPSMVTMTAANRTQREIPIHRYDHGIYRWYRLWYDHWSHWSYHARKLPTEGCTISAGNCENGNYRPCCEQGSYLYRDSTTETTMLSNAWAPWDPIPAGSINSFDGPDSKK